MNPKPFFTPDNPFFIADTRKTRWAVPYHLDCLNARVKTLITKNKTHIENKTLLDVASHIGTFSYTALRHGAKHVTGIECEKNLTDKAEELFRQQNIDTQRFQFHTQTIDDFLDHNNATFDTVLCLGMLYYVTEPLRLLKRLVSITKCLILDTFLAPYAALQGKDAQEILPNLNSTTFDLPMLLTSRTQKDKKDYQLPESYPTHDKDLALTTFPTEKLLEIWFDSLNLDYQKLDWSEHLPDKPITDWQKLLTPDQKKNSHWTDIYSTGVRISFCARRKPSVYG